VEACPFNSSDVDKDILSAILRLDETKALLAVEPFYDTSLHLFSFRVNANSGALHEVNAIDVQGERGKAMQLMSDAGAEPFGRNSMGAI
jgi:hypothetical protein